MSALNQQVNWTISMADNLEQVKKRGKVKPLMKHMHYETEDSTVAKLASLDLTPKVWTTPPVYLPDEIIIQIVEHVAQFRSAQITLASCCRLSRQWYSAAVPLLYTNPWIDGKNFDAFVRAICPSKNLHVRKSPLAEFVKVLDMSHLVYSGDKATTARLLSRTKGNIEEFVAPQATFGMNSFAALAKSRGLKVLDLSLVSESPPLVDLFKTISGLTKLSRLRLPRSAGFSQGFNAAAMTWPPNLEDLCLSGGIDVHFLQGVVSFPDSLRSLTVEHCPMAKTGAILHLLRTAMRPLPNLEILKLSNLPRLIGNSLDDVLVILPGLTKLSISVDYITPQVFDLGTDRAVHGLPDIWLPPGPRHGAEPQCQLRTLELTNSGNPGVEDKITPIDVLIAVEDGSLPKLRQIRVAKSLFWQSGSNADETSALGDALQDAAAKSELADEMESGVWTFDG
ncbi:Putative F-box domain, leucine-rich repeat domain superfamily [Septoria linicola]|uniref:F-box domain, leucine-rich repeat domain superfamily n=1 Tax=Septoria linicola TaxID=215465 RepID=A0A9Q9EH28_9PEZI|nr:putative F-box domain, leucine-rich repeat domain superfamily [Septoria linicola]USW50595.1 Putative F-box domain, leucine-rich repeat domain superfamily [Septoria linicola]